MKQISSHVYPYPAEISYAWALLIADEQLVVDGSERKDSEDNGCRDAEASREA